MNDLLRLACLMALTGITAAQSPAPSTAPAVESSPGIPLKWSRGLMTLPVEIQTKVGSLMVDTGAATTCLRESAAAELKVTLTPAEDVKGAGIAGEFDKVMTGNVAIRVPGQKPEAFPKLSGDHTFIPIAAVEGDDGDYGVIGLDDLSEAGGVIDCVNGTMHLHPAGDFRSPKGFLEIPMKRRIIDSEAEGARDFLWTLPVRIGGKDGLMVVDTAAGATVLDESFAKQAGVELHASETTAAGAGHARQALTEGTVPELVLGGKVKLGSIQVNGSDLSAVRRNIHSGEGDAPPFAGILGMDQLIRVRAILDCKQGVFHSTGEALSAPMDPELIMKALTLLVAKDDPQAVHLQDDAVKNGGNLNIEPMEASELILRAVGQGLIESKELAGKADVTTAIMKLAEAGDEEAKKFVAEAAANNGAFEITPEAADQLVTRAREKGLLGK